MNAQWQTNAPTIRARFDAAIPGALTEVGKLYARQVRTVLGQTFPSGSGQTAGSVKISKLSGTSRFRIRVFTRWPRARFWELGWRHWKQARRGLRGRKVFLKGTRRHRRQVWRPVLFENMPRYRELMRRRLEAAVGRRLRSF